MRQQVYLHPYPKELMLRNDVQNRGCHNQTRVHTMGLEQLAEAAHLLYNHLAVVQLYN
jgi:hypothetical protein